MPSKKSAKNTARKNRSRRISRRVRKTQRQRKTIIGGRLGFRLPPDAVFAAQQNAYSTPVMTDTKTAEDMFEDREPYLL